jgi:hypothetical protein
MFELTRAPCFILDRLERADPRGEGAGLENLLTLVVDLTDAVIGAASDRLLPGLDRMACSIAADEQHKGVDLKSRMSLPHQRVQLFERVPPHARRDDDVPRFSWIAEVKGAPVFHVDKEGQGNVTLKLLVKASKAEMSALTEWLQADMEVSLIAAQTTIQEAITEKARANQAEQAEQAGLFGDEDEELVARAEALVEDSYQRTLAGMKRSAGEAAGAPVVEPEPIEPFDPSNEVKRAVERLKRTTLAAGARMTITAPSGEAVVIEPAEVEHPERPKRRKSDRLGVTS